MLRKVNDSSKRRKAQLQNKRAQKRGDEPLHPEVKPKAVRDFGRTQKSLAGEEATARLRSKFIWLTPEYLERTRALAHSTELTRPIPPTAAIFPINDMSRDGGHLRCPARPRFKFGQTKKEVERNEDGIFRKWMKETEDIVRDWVEGGKPEVVEEQDGERVVQDYVEVDETWPRSPSLFETNLEVWRQLWRVTESTSILLLLLDARCPPLHCPPSLKAHVQSLNPHKEVVLVLTKADLVDPIALEGWKVWVRDWWGRAVEVVSVMSYDLEYLNESGKHRPDIPLQSLAQLLSALQNAHERLLQPPEYIREKPEKLARWVPLVRKTIDWNGLLPHNDSGRHRGPSLDEPRGTLNADAADKQNEPLAIGLIGQPNVGKSSLLNALLGEQRVRASKTPGKTKHFQTIFWGDKKEVKMVDCPGLVCPSLIGLEMQALAGILPISQIPSIPACIHHAAALFPLEEIFRVPPPESNSLDPYAAKKTWRQPKEAVVEDTKIRWTAGNIMEGRALDRGFLTAKGGRPDGNRAGNAIMRTLADGRIRWGFWPPQVDVSSREGKGIWLDTEAHPDHLDDTGQEEIHSSKGRVSGDEGGVTAEEDYLSDGETEDEDEDEDELVSDVTEEEEADEEEESEEQRKQAPVQAKLGGFFAALDVDDGSDEDAEVASEEGEEGS